MIGWWRAGAKDYGWSFGIPGVLVAEVWCREGVACRVPWGDAS